MAEDKKLKVTNRATSQTWMKTPAEIQAIKNNKVLASRFTFEREVDTPELAPKISASKSKPTSDVEPKE